MSYLKLILNFIKYLIIENTIKLIMIDIMIAASVIAFKFAGTIKGGHEYYNIVSQVKDGNTYVYVTNSKSESNNGYEVFTREIRIFDMSDVYRLPKFSTKTQKRDNLLDKLGI